MFHELSKTLLEVNLKDFRFFFLEAVVKYPYSWFKNVFCHLPNMYATGNNHFILRQVVYIKTWQLQENFTFNTKAIKNLYKSYKSVTDFNQFIILSAYFQNIIYPEL